MNFINYYQFRSLLTCIPLTLSNGQLQARLIASIFRVNYLRNFERKCFLCTSTKLLAGHSKWSNIKNIKEAKDLERGQLFEKLSKLIRKACKESGGVDPKLNSELARVITQAKNANMPNATIENALKKAENTGNNAKPGSVVLVAPGGIFVVADVLTDNMKRTRQQIIGLGKKANLKEVRSSIDGVFEEKGVIVTKGEHSKAVDHAIEIGAEDVTEEDEMLTFVCDPKDFFTVRKRIQDLKYEIDYASVDRIPIMLAAVKEDDADKFKRAIERIEEHEEVERVCCNFEI